MRLTNGVAITPPSPQSSFATEGIGGAASTTATVHGTVLVPHSSGTAYIRGQFSNELSDSTLAMTISDDTVFVSSIDDMYVEQSNKRIISTKALCGTKGVSTGQLRVSATLANGRKIVSLFDGQGRSTVPVVPGLVTFTTSTAAAISVDSLSGEVLLLDNFQAAAVVTATVAAGLDGTVLKAITAFHTNLNPASAGDVDLGPGDGQPLTDHAVGQNVDVAVRVNTGGLYLGTFDLYVYFDPTVLSIQDPQDRRHLQLKQETNRLGHLSRRC
jgi:hypothetical protein